MSYDPVGHEATVASTRYSQLLFVDPGITFKCSVNSVHDVDVVFTTPLAFNPAFKLLTIAGRTARIGEEDRITLRCIDLKLVIPIDTVLPGRSAMDTKNHRILLAVLPSGRFYEETIDVPIVRALISEALNISQLKLLPKSVVKVCEFAFLRSFKIRHIKIIEMLEVVFGVNHCLRAVIEIHIVHSAGTRGDLFKSSLLKICAKQVVLAFNSCFEVEG